MRTGHYYVGECVGGPWDGEMAAHHAPPLLVPMGMADIARPKDAPTRYGVYAFRPAWRFDKPATWEWWGER